MKRYALVFGLLLPVLTCAQISPRMKSYLKKAEGLSLQVYMDGYYRAVGYGHRIVPTDIAWVQELEPFDEITPEAAELIFNLDMIYLVGPGLTEVIKDIGLDYPSNVYDVMGSLIYNMGLKGLRETEFYRCFKRKDYERSFRMLLVTKISKPGLRERRLEETVWLMENFDRLSGKYRVTVPSNVASSSDLPFRP